MKRLAMLLAVIVSAAEFVHSASARPSPGARAQLLAAPKPIYPEAAIQRRIVGHGQFRLNMDIETGKPMGIAILKSTGSPLLDRAAIKALSQWRAVPGGIRRIELPISFQMTSRGASVAFER